MHDRRSFRGHRSRVSPAPTAPPVRCQRSTNGLLSRSHRFPYERVTTPRGVLFNRETSSFCFGSYSHTCRDQTTNSDAGDSCDISSSDFNSSDVTYTNLVRYHNESIKCDLFSKVSIDRVSSRVPRTSRPFPSRRSTRSWAPVRSASSDSQVVVTAPHNDNAAIAVNRRPRHRCRGLRRSLHRTRITVRSRLRNCAPCSARPALAAALPGPTSRRARYGDGWDPPPTRALPGSSFPTRSRPGS